MQIIIIITRVRLGLFLYAPDWLKARERELFVVSCFYVPEKEISFWRKKNNVFFLVANVDEKPLFVRSLTSRS